MAVKTGKPVVPITLIGTGKLMPNGQESRLYGGNGVRIIVHPRIEVGLRLKMFVEQLVIGGGRTGAHHALAW